MFWVIFSVGKQLLGCFQDVAMQYFGCSGLFLNIKLQGCF